MNAIDLLEAIGQLDDRFILEAFAEKTSPISPIEFRQKKNSPIFNWRSSKRLIAIVAIAAAFLIGTTAFAIGIFASGWFSGKVAEFEQSSTQQFIREEGYKPIHIQSFSNGYIYSRGHVLENQINDAELGVVDTFKSTTFEYEKNGDLLYFTQEKSGFPVNQFGTLFESYKGIELWYYSYINKFVPDGYEMSEEEKEAESRGELIITYGPEEISSVRVSSLSWCVDGINYNLMQTDGKLSAEELCRMAREIILTDK